MNRIYELAKEAGMIEFDAIPGFNVVTPDHTSVVKAQKFAELIIRECLVQVCDEVQYQYDWKLADAVTKRVLEHFGVEW